MAKRPSHRHIFEGPDVSVDRYKDHIPDGMAPQIVVRKAASGSAVINGVGGADHEAHRNLIWSRCLGLSRENNVFAI